MQTTNIQIRVKTGVKNQAMEILETYDLTMSEAFRLFLNEIIRTKSIPVNLKAQTNLSTLNTENKDEDLSSNQLLQLASKNLNISSKSQEDDNLIY
jgi:DNA-damage-inducible protein J